MQSEIESLVAQFESHRLSRRDLVASLMALLGGASAGASPGSSSRVAQGRSLNHVSLAVSNVGRAAEFYSGLLGLDVVSRPGNGGINLGLGTSFLGLYEIPDPGRAHHFCVGVEDYEPDALAERLQRQGIEPNVDRNPNNRTSGGDQLYFRDPDGTLVQLSANGYQG